MVLSLRESQAEQIEGGQRIGVVGIGLMGTALSHRLLDHGYDVIVWNRTQEEAIPLIERGAKWSDNPLMTCDRVVISLFSSDIVRQVLERLDGGMRPSQILIDTTTGSPEDAVHLAEQLSGRGVRYLDAPISGSSAQTRSGDVLIMVGGDRTAFEECLDLWEILSRAVHYTGKSGSASKMKLVTNLVLGLNRAALAEGLAYAEAIGVDSRAALQVLQNSAAASRVMEVKGEKMLQGDFSPQARLSQHLKDVRIILETAQAKGLDLPLSEAHRALLELAEQMGCGELDNCSIIRTYNSPQNSKDSEK